MDSLENPKRYEPSEIEPKWQRYWDDHRTFSVDNGDKPGQRKFYVLDMFPYPSGKGLHVGHPRGYVASDVVARFKRMQGYAVLHPMGWDSFGLPTERQAEKEHIHPAEVTTRNIDTFRQQLQILGLSYDWGREFATSSPDYYKWTQWIFLKLYERGLAYLADVPVNWCPALNTVLANEEVADGVYVETGDPVERRLMRQWMLRITAYAERLLSDLELLESSRGSKSGDSVNGRSDTLSETGCSADSDIWGEPIPIIMLEDGAIKPVPESDLPVLLPGVLPAWNPGITDPAPLARATSWVATVDPTTGRPARRETNTISQWAGSSWYFLRFVDPRNSNAAWSSAAERRWMPVDLYIGGAERATLHLLYARFWHKVLFDLGYVSTPEPFRRLFNQGMVHSRSYRDQRGKYYYPDEVIERDGHWYTKEDDRPVETQIEEMSKSRNNGISPEEIVEQYGADSFRIYEVFMGPMEDSVLWQTDGIVGVRRFLDRVWRVAPILPGRRSAHGNG